MSGSAPTVLRLASYNCRQPPGTSRAPVPDTEAFQRDLPRARTVVLEECGHMPMLERPRVFNRSLIDFVEALPY